MRLNRIALAAALSRGSQKQPKVSQARKRAPKVEPERPAEMTEDARMRLLRELERERDPPIEYWEAKQYGPQRAGYAVRYRH